MAALRGRARHRVRTVGCPLDGALETFIRREDAERFIEEVRSDDPELASYLRIEERELEAGGRNYVAVSPSRTPRRTATRTRSRRNARCECR
jgi:hypothetical protein